MDDSQGSMCYLHRMIKRLRVLIMIDRTAPCTLARPTIINCEYPPTAELFSMPLIIAQSYPKWVHDKNYVVHWRCSPTRFSFHMYSNASNKMLV
jgi:hypothetical protein